MQMPPLPERPGFDSWANLARENPQAFEEQRFLVLDQAIREAPARVRPRLRGLQWQLDRIRDTSASPLAASLRMQRLLWEYVTGPGGLLARLQALDDPARAHPRGGTSATILEFRRADPATTDS
jgi:hypothetical protein